VYHGPGLGCEIRDGLVERARRDGFERVRDAVGADHR
jgi:dihydroorotate dehydrogenase